MKPTISVIVPVYKAEPYLDRCVKSILTQTYTDFELILVDDGSPDHCPAMCDAYAEKDTRVRVIHKENGGVSTARNVGLAAATGEFVAFVDSDDYVEKTYLQILLLGDSDLSICGCYYCDKNGIQTEVARQEVGRTETVNRENLGKWFDHGSLYSVWTGMFRREIIEKIALRFDCNTFRGEDTIFMLTYIEQCHTVTFHSEILYNYVRYGEGTLTTTAKNPLNFKALAYLDCYLSDWFLRNGVQSALFSSPFFWTRQETKLQLIDTLTDCSLTFSERYRAFKVFFSISHFNEYVKRLLSHESRKLRTLIQSRSCMLLMAYSIYLRKKQNKKGCCL